MRARILLLDEPHPKARAIMEEVAECVKQIPCDIVYTQLTPINTSKPVFCPCTGTDHIQAPEIIHLDEQWKANEGREVTSTAEHTFSLLLQLAKFNRMQLKGKTLGIIGHGRIGTQVEQYARAFDMQVCWYDKNVELWIFYRMLQTCDIITLHIPLEGNEGFIGEKEFAMMKHGALLVNTSRAEIVSEKALGNWLKRNINNRYADDFYASHSHEFLKAWYNYDGEADKIILTEHIAGNCLEAREATDLYIANKIKAYIEGGL
jgi:lactate dehydrogenase-like 2-hydroxyacid dehydrogenase